MGVCKWLNKLTGIPTLLFQAVFFFGCIFISGGFLITYLLLGLFQSLTGNEN